MRTVTIDRVMNGYVVGVGCQRLVFETREALLRELGLYLEKPHEVEKEYAKRCGFAGAEWAATGVPEIQALGAIGGSAFGYAATPTL